MYSMIPEHVLQKLITAGITDDPFGSDSLAILESIKEHHEVNSLRPETWQAICEPLSSEDLVAIIKSLTVLEEKLGWKAGSVSGIIWVTKILQWRFSDKYSSVVDWVLQRTSNPYAPFGTVNLGAKSLEDFYRLEDMKIQRRKIAEEISVRQRAEAQERRRAEKKLKKKRIIIQLKMQHQKSLERNKVLLKILKMNPIAQLVFIAHDSKHKIDYYPDKFALCEDKVLEGLDKETRELFTIKLVDRKKGVWKKFIKRIRGIIEKSNQIK